MSLVQVTKKYVVSVPDEGTAAYKDLLDEMLSEDPDYAYDPESMQPQVLRGALAYFLVQKQEFDISRQTDLVEYEDYDMDDIAEDR